MQIRNRIILVFLVGIAFGAVAAQGPLFVVSHLGKSVAIDTAGRVVIDFGDYRVGRMQFDHGAIPIQRSGRPMDTSRVATREWFQQGDSVDFLGLMDMSGKLVLPPNYPSVQPIGNGLFRILAHKDRGGYSDGRPAELDQCYLANRNGLLLDGLLLDRIEQDWVGMRLLVWHHGRGAVVDADGNLKTGFEYDAAMRTRSSPTRLWIHSDNGWFRVGDKGDLIRMDWPDDPQFLLIGWGMSGRYVLSFPEKLVGVTITLEEEYGLPSVPTDLHSYHKWFITAQDELIAEREFHRRRLAEIGLQVTDHKGKVQLLDSQSKQIAGGRFLEFQLMDGGLIRRYQFPDAAAQFSYFHASQLNQNQYLTMPGNVQISILSLSGRVFASPRDHVLYHDTAGKTLLVRRGSRGMVELLDDEGNVLLRNRALTKVLRFQEGFAVTTDSLSGFMDRAGNWLLQKTAHDIAALEIQNGWMWYRDYAPNHEGVYAKSIRDERILGPIHLVQLDSRMMEFLIANPLIASEAPRIQRAKCGPLITHGGFLSLYKDDGSELLRWPVGRYQRDLLESSFQNRSVISSDGTAALLDESCNVLLPLGNHFLIQSDDGYWGVAKEDSAHMTVSIHAPNNRLMRTVQLK